ncbi:uncharacterized protein LOC110028738 [Phalaenopsis equestris]|uniref:uncharacterized protein LOC110028738 n=1 Tax=Phalaenopsis equestris TaxID=78828 RepID=UPI0009E225CD|nr:uncharacterized protein LOC110028738 [Phalaenopsis equestris]
MASSTNLFFTFSILLSLIFYSTHSPCHAARSLLENDDEPDISPYPDFPELPKPELPPFPKPELPPLFPELPPFPEIPGFPKPELPSFPEIPHDLPKLEFPPLPELPHVLPEEQKHP